MASAPDVFESAADEVVATLPAPKKSWISRVYDNLLYPRKPGKKIAEASAKLPQPSEARLNESLGEKSYDESSTLPPTVLYLAYGSNLCHETFQGRRGIRPLSAVNVVVPGLELVFDLPGVPYIEPCFANSARRDEADSSHLKTQSNAVNEKSALLGLESQTRALVGVVYEVTDRDYGRIIATEGPAYTDVVVQCYKIPSKVSTESQDVPTTAFQAHTLLAPISNLRPRQAKYPAQASLRYLTLCRNGAKEHSLPAEWQEYLNGLQHYHTTSIRQIFGKVLFVAIWGPIVLTSMTVRRVLGGKNGNASGLSKKIMAATFQSMWISYDYFFKIVFGDGERTQS